MSGIAAVGAIALVATAWLTRSSVGTAPAETMASALSIDPLTDADGLSLSGSWSPDATQLAYDYTLNGSMDIAVMSLGGGEPRLVAGGPNDEAMPRWSPDGSRIAFLSDDGTGTNIYWVPPTGGARRKIAETRLQYLERFTSIDAIGSQPWSPDGRRLVFSRLEPTNNSALWTTDIQSGQEARLTSPPAGASDLRSEWSHDGKWIAFNRWSTSAPSRLYLVPSAGGEPRAMLPENKISRAAVTWSPDDRQLLFVPGGVWGGDVWELDIGTGRIRQLTVGAESIPRSSRPKGVSASRTGAMRRSSSGCLLPTRWPSTSRSRSARATISASGSRRTACRWCSNRVAVVRGRCCGFMRWRRVRSASSPILPPDARTERRTGRPMGSAWCFSRIATARSNCGSGMSMAVLTSRLSDQAIPMDGDWWVNARVAPRWSSDGKAIAYLAPGDQGSTLWLMDPDGRNARQTRLSRVSRFDWYLDSGLCHLHAQRRGRSHRDGRDNGSIRARSVCF